MRLPPLYKNLNQASKYSFIKIHFDMKKTFTILLLVGIWSISSNIANAQIAIGSVAPDFTLTDVNGNEHNLYDILDDDKMVVIDFMTTWCSPCWDFHQTNVFKEIHDLHGPMAADDIYVFMIEADLNTSVDALEGVGSNTIGNWLDGVDYPVINLESEELIFQYEIFAFPTMITICSDKLITVHNDWQQTTVASIEAISDDCPYPVTDFNAGILDFITTELDGCGELNFEPQIVLQNKGLGEMTSATIDYYVDNDLQETLNWVGTLGTYEVEVVSFSSIVLNETSNLKFEITSVNGITDEDLTDNILIEQVVASPLIETDSLTVEILTDMIPAETYWAILNSNDEVVAEGGNVEMGFLNNSSPSAPVIIPVDGNEYQGQTTLYTHDITLPQNGCYTFALADWYGDGISSFAQGYYRISDKNGNEIFYGDAGAFYRLDIPFEYAGLTVGLEESQANIDVRIFGNPVVEKLFTQIEVPNKTSIDISIFDIAGKEVFRMTTEDYIGKTNKVIDTTKLNAGIYLLQVSSPQFKKTLKFVKK